MCGSVQYRKAAWNLSSVERERESCDRSVDWWSCHGPRQVDNSIILLCVQPCCCCCCCYSVCPSIGPNSAALAAARSVGTSRRLARPSPTPTAIRHVIHSTISGLTSRDCPLCCLPSRHSSPKSERSRLQIPQAQPRQLTLEKSVTDYCWSRIFILLPDVLQHVLR